LKILLGIEVKKQNFSWDRVFPIVILVIGLGLRLFSLGQHSFWLDETGVAISAAQPTLGGALHIARTHVSAMPLDYVVAWGMGRVSLAEGWLRLPAVIWGTAALWVGYGLFRRLLGDEQALIATAFMAVHPVLVQLSQELRFYAALLFFSLLGLALLLRALSRGDLASWLWATAVVALGAYFHIFIVLVYVTAGLYALLCAPGRGQKAQRFLHLGLSALTAAAAILPGYLYFCHLPEGASQFYLPVAPLLILKGFYWIPSFLGPGVWWLCGVLFLLEVSGMLFSIRERNRAAMVLFISVAVQVAFVVGVDALAGYFVAGRQVVMLVPFSLMFAAIGAWEIGQRLKGFSARIAPGAQTWVRWAKWAAAAGLVIVTLAAAFPALAVYYRQEKSRGRELSQVLAQRWRPGDAVWVLPLWERQLYQYYLGVRLQREDILASFQKNPWNEVTGSSLGAGTVYVITSLPLDGAVRERLQAAGFVPDPVWGSANSDVDILWIQNLHE
jgi:4-amino-4-deoxy-L-arabinose transferase-like glycosyltransferase